MQIIVFFFFQSIVFNGNIVGTQCDISSGVPQSGEHSMFLCYHDSTAPAVPFILMTYTWKAVPSTPLHPLTLPPPCSGNNPFPVFMGLFLLLFCFVFYLFK